MVALCGELFNNAQPPVVSKCAFANQQNASLYPGEPLTVFACLPTIPFIKLSLRARCKSCGYFFRFVYHLPPSAHTICGQTNNVCPNDLSTVCFAEFTVPSGAQGLPCRNILCAGSGSAGIRIGGFRLFFTEEGGAQIAFCTPPSQRFIIRGLGW